MGEAQKWSQLARELVQLVVSAVVGTIVLLALADNPYDGDELFKGPLVGISSYGGDRSLRKLLGKE